MNRNEWYKVGEDIRKQVQHAIDTNDYSELSKGISETVSHAANDVGKSLNDVGKSINDISKGLNDVVNDAADSFQKGMKQSFADINRQTSGRTEGQIKERHPGAYYGKPNLRPNPKLFEGTPRGSISGVLWMVLGFGTMGVATLTAVYSGLGALVGMESVTTLALPLTGMAAGGALGTYGARLRSRVERYHRYVDLVKDKLYCSIEELAERTGRSKRFIRRDLKKMMQKRMFLQAHMDKRESCFIASDAVYEQYMLTQKQYEQAQIEQKSATEKQKKTDVPKATDVADSKVANILEEGKEYIRFIQKCNDEIPGEEMSEKLDKLELLVTRIFARVEDNPELATDLQKMMSYYLPTTQKLLEAYRDLDKQDLEVKNISETKREIEKTMDTINKAFEGFLDDLFRDRAWDIQSDISVLNTMLKQDGYLKSDFEKGEKE